MADESSTGSSNNMEQEQLPVKAIFNKTIETSSNFLTDIWKPRDQVDNQGELKKSCHEEFDNGFDSDSDGNSLPFDDSCDEKEYYNDFDSLKSYKGTELRPPYCVLTFLRRIEDDDGEGPSPFQVFRPVFGGRDTDNSTENSSESFYERRPVMAIMSYVGDKGRHSEMKATDDTSGQKMGWQSLVKPSRPPPKPPRESDGHPEVNQVDFSFSVNRGGSSFKITRSVGTKVCVTPVTDSSETDKSTTDVKKTHFVTESGIKPHKIKPNQTVTESSHSVSTEEKTAADGIHTDLIQPQFFRQTGFSKQPNLSQSLPASNKHKTSQSEAEQHKLSLSVSFNSKNNQDSSLNPTSSSECDKKTFDLDQNELPGNKLKSNTIQHSSSGGSLSSKLASRQSSNGSSFSPSSYNFEDQDEFDDPDDYVTACEEPIHKQKHNHDLFYQKESSFYEDLEDSYSYCNYDTDQHPANDDLHCTHRTHDCNHTQCNHQGSTSFAKTQHMLYHLANSERLEVHDVVPDGNCMFRAIVDQMRMQGEITMTCNQIRQMAVENLRENPLQEDGTHMEDFFVAADGESWEQYLKRMSKDGEWGDQIILRGLSEVIHREICIISTIGDRHNQISIVPKQKKGKICLGHVNDQHYYSLRPKGWQNIWYKEARKICILRNKDQKQRSLDNDVTSVESEQDLTPPCRNSQLINCNNEYYDEYSHVPVFHLTFIMENVIEKSNLITGHKLNMTNEDTFRSTFEFVGSVEEDLAVNLFPLNIQSLQGMGNEDFNAPKVSMYPNFYRIIDTQSVVFQHDSYEINSDIYVINSEDTNPGYTRLHASCKKLSHSYYREIDGTLCLTTSQFLTSKSKYPDMNKPPSYMTLSPFKKSQSICFCYKCPRWPDQTREWISRKRLSGWPQESLLNEVVTIPCVLTPNSHPCSNEPDVEWMFNFSFPERFLLKDNISKEQRYCFHVFKLLIDFHTGRMEDLSTFVLKTIFMYTLEVLPQLQWDHCPSACVIYMIDILLESLKERKIPHYFLPENNIIEHLSGGLIYSLVEKVNAVREFPIMSIIIMAESHGVMSTYVTDQIIEDLNCHSTHNSIQDSILHTFVPAYIKIISISLALRKFRQSADAAVSGYKMLQDLFQGNEGNYNPYENMSLFRFIREAMDDSMPLYQVWWLCFFIDYYKKTNTLSSFVHTNPFKKISDMMDGFPPGDLDDISVPNHVLSYGQKGNVCGRDLEFLLTMCTFLMSENEFQQCAHYLRGLIQIVNKKIANPESFVPGCQPGQGERMGYMMQSIIASLYTTLQWILHALFSCYQKQQQTEYFQEYIEQLESVCDVLASHSAYQTLAEIWQALGNRKKMNEVIAKQRCLQG